MANAALGSRKDLRDAVVAARKGYAAWSKATAYNRGQVIYRIAEMLQGRRTEFVELIMISTGASTKIATAEVDVAIDRLVHAGLIRLPRLIELMSTGPARILRVPGGSLSPGSPADITVLAPDLKVRIRAAQMRSRSKNTPFDGWELRGGVVATIVAGRTVYTNPDVETRL